MNGPHFAEILPEMISSWLETLRHARALHATPAAWLGSPASPTWNPRPLQGVWIKVVPGPGLTDRVSLQRPSPSPADFEQA